MLRTRNAALLLRLIEMSASWHVVHRAAAVVLPMATLQGPLPECHAVSVNISAPGKTTSVHLTKCRVLFCCSRRKRPSASR